MPSLYEGLGSEQVMDLIDLTFRKKLNDAIDYQDVIGSERDHARAEELADLGAPVSSTVEVEMEHVQPTNFHVGSVPSFVQTYDDRYDNYPLIAVAPGRTAPDPENSRADQYDIFQNSVSIHMFTRAQPMEDVEHAEIAWRRGARMAEAVHQVMTTDRDLSRILGGVSGPQMVDRSEPWYYPVEDGQGEDWCWVWIMHMYAVKNYSQKPQEV